MSTKSVTRRCTQVRAGQQIELAGGIVVKNPSQYKINLIIETPIGLIEKQQETSSNANPTKIS